MFLLQILAVTCVLIARHTLSAATNSPTESTSQTPEYMSSTASQQNSTLFVSFSDDDDSSTNVYSDDNDGNISFIISVNETIESTITPRRKPVAKQKLQPIVSKETKDLVLEIVNCGLLPIVCLFGLFGNIMSLVVLFIQGSKERTNIILIGLSVSDTFFLITTILRKASCLVSKADKNAGYDFNVMMQPQVFMLNILFGRLSSAMTLLISIERFIAVYFPLKAHFFLTPLRLKIAVGSIYFILCLAMAPLMAFYKIVYVFSNRQKRVIPLAKVSKFYEDNEETLDIYLNHVLNIAFRYIPMALVCFFTILNIGRIKKSSSWRRKSSSKSWKGTEQVTNMLLLVNAIYILCLMPGTISLSARAFVDGYNFSGTYSNIFKLMGAIIVLVEAFNSAINFIIYMAMSKKFAATYKRVFLCWRRRADYSENTMDQSTALSTITTASTTTM